MRMRKPVWMTWSPEPVEVFCICSWCGIRVDTALQQRIHEDWHRAVGVVPLKAPAEDDV